MSISIVIIYLVSIIGVLFFADAAVGLIRAARGVNDEAIERRLQRSKASGQWLQQPVFLKKTEDTAPWMTYVPLAYQLNGLIEQSGLKAKTSYIMILMGTISFITLVVVLYLMPIRYSWSAIPTALMIGVVPVLVFIFQARSKRWRMFEEQLPDALDLIVRSLRIGHPFSGAMQVIARDMPSPICDEFSRAYEQVNFGRDIPSTLNEMVRRVGASDLAYIAMAVQIQQESGGNLVESLAKLADIVRDRFRMFRKVKAITAEGRFSAWMLSLFPIAIILAIQAVKPDYYTQVMDYPYFPYLAGGVVVALVVNVIMMRILTSLEV